MMRLKEQFDLDQMIVVADAGMLSQENLSLLQSLGCDYVVAARLRSLNQVHTQAIVGEQSWTMLSTGRKVSEHTLGGRRLILRYCPKKAARDVHKRDQAVEKVKKRLAQGVKGVGRSGRFLKVDPQGVRLDEAAIARDQNYDGLHGVWTSLTDLPPEQVYHHYGELWRIEEGFRVMKHTMAVRPMFHWVERRVRAHVAICFCGFCAAAHSTPPLQYPLWRKTTTERGTDPGRTQPGAGLAHSRSRHRRRISPTLQGQG